MSVLEDINIKEEMALFPTTRYMGSKRKILQSIYDVVKDVEYESVFDAFSGSGCVSYLFKRLGKRVISNDYLAYSYYICKAAVENNRQKLSASDIEMLLEKNVNAGNFIRKTFNGLYFTPADNRFLDNTSANIQKFRNAYKIALAKAALCRAAMKKQPRGVFTVIGQRYDDGRADLRLTMKEQFLRAVSEFNEAVFDNEQDNQSLNINIFEAKKADGDLVYIDPPYYSKHSDNDYVRRYHFLEGLTSYWKDTPVQSETRTKRIEKRPTPFSSKKECYGAFDRLFTQFSDRKVLVSYSSNSLPTKDEMEELLHKYFKRVETFSVDHKYSFGNHAHKIGDNKNDVSEYLFLGH